MSDLVKEFFNEVQATQMLWALHDKDSDGWVVVDSANFENSETMPLWSTESMAQKSCSDEWASYQPVQISVSDWLEFWFEDLNEDGVIVGLDWQDDQDCEEMELGEFTHKIADIEKL
mgnify:FL=1